LPNFQLDMREQVSWRRDNDPEAIRRGGVPIISEGAGTLFDAVGHAGMCPYENRGLFKIWRADDEEISGGRLETLVRAQLHRNSKV
jgi:hypothetical protein